MHQNTTKNVLEHLFHWTMTMYFFLSFKISAVFNAYALEMD